MTPRRLEPEKEKTKCKLYVCRKTRHLAGQGRGHDFTVIYLFIYFFNDLRISMLMADCRE